MQIKIIRYSTGFTLLELMVALAIGAILAAFAVPNYQAMIKNNCLTTTTNNLVTSFQQARSEAIKRKTTVSIISNNGTNWANGWQLFLDEDRNSNGALDTNEDYDGDGVLDTGATPATDWVLMRAVTNSCTATTITGDNASYNYGSNGFINSAGSFILCDDREKETGRQITINAVGRPSTNSTYNGCD